MNQAHPRATAAPASARAEVRLTYSDSPCAGVAAPAPSVQAGIAAAESAAKADRGARS